MSEGDVQGLISDVSLGLQMSAVWKLVWCWSRNAEGKWRDAARRDAGVVLTHARDDDSRARCDV